MKSIFAAVQALFFPPLCLFCDQLMPTNRPLFCADCRAVMAKLDPKERCRCCFQLLEDSLPLCPTCRGHCTPFHLATVFSYDSPAAALIKQLKYGGKEELAPLMASWMIIQLQDLEIPWPDALVPIPQSLPRRIVRGYNPSHQLATAMSKLMRIPVLHPLRRVWTSFPQAGKNLQERTAMSKNEFFLRSSVSIEGKNILLIDDVITTGTTLSRCAKALQPAFPNSVHGLGFCLA